MRQPFLLALSLVGFLFFQPATAQKTGVINRQATSAAGRLVLDPNGDGYTSASTSGFGASDVLNSELSFYSVPCFSLEPYGDLRRGPNHLYSDFVPDVNGNGVYLKYTAGGNLIFRFRVGSVMSGSKGYSILIDTDNKFGATGANADPNYQPATTGTNGNPGFEIEIVLETNFRIAIYNVDGSSTPTLIKSYTSATATTWQDLSQISVAGTFDNGDPDFFIDFYIPFSDLQAAPFNLTTNSDLRFSATTVMSPQAAIGGPKSDIYGLADNGYTNPNDEYEAYINAQPTVKLSGTGFGAMCTAAPLVNNPILTGTVNISGTWTKSALAGAAGTTTITVYKNGVSAGTVANVSSGSTWTLNNVALSSGDVITAKAQSTGESMCLVSNSVTASSCNSANRPATPLLDCYSTSKGISGTNLSTGWTVHVDNITRNTADNHVTNSTGLFATPTGSSPNLTWTYSNGCTSGSPLISGSYKIYYTNNSNGCNSEPAYVCAAGNGGSALAGSLAISITVPSNGIYTTATTKISGTTDASASLNLYINGTVVQSTTASGAGTFSFSNLNLASGQQLYITAELNTGTVSSSKCAAQTSIATVACFTSTPLITADSNNLVTAGAPITGTSGEPAGATIRVYNSSNTLLATTTVQANGSWSTGNAGTTPAAYNAVSTTIYYATAQNGSCTVSAASVNVTGAAATSTARCGTITGPVTASASSISGTLTGSFTSTTVNLYLDGIKIGSASTNNAAWGPITVNTNASNTLYPNGILTIGLQETSKQETTCSASALTITCASPPAAPMVSPANFTITQNQAVTYTISNAVTGYFYGIADGTSGKSLATGVWATSNGSLSITTNNFTSSGSYNVVVKSTSLSGLTVCSSTPASATVAVNGILPSKFLNIAARAEGNANHISWLVTNEENVAYYAVERSSDCIHFSAVGQVNYSAVNGDQHTYSFIDASPISKACYRIRAMDRNGLAHYSSTVMVQSHANGMLRLLPNPAVSALTLSVQSSREGSVLLQLMDMNGKILRKETMPVRAGSNALSMEGLERFARGQYLVKLSTPEGVMVQKLLLQ